MSNEINPNQNQTPVTLNQDLVDILNLWKQTHVFKGKGGSIDERKAKFQNVHSLINTLYNRNVTLSFGTITEETEDLPGSSVNSYYNHVTDTINLSGRLSVITYLHEWGHAIGLDETDAQIFATLHFKTCFPKSFAKLHHNEGDVMYTLKPLPKPTPEQISPDDNYDPESEVIS